MVYLKPKKKHRDSKGAGLMGDGRMEAKDMVQWVKAMGGKVKG
jgi:hypothetical protein